MSEPGKLPAEGFRRIAERGFFAGRSVPPTPSLTAVAHATIATGALPQDTGIVSNTMLDRSRAFPATISGFDAPLRAETLWQAARRQGRRVGVMQFPFADGKAPARTADWAMNYVNEKITPGRLETVDASSWKASPAPAAGSFSPERRLAVAFGRPTHTVTFVAVDRTDDGRVNYDQLRVEPEAGAPSEVTPGDWFPAEVRGEGGRAGAWCKLVSLSPDLSRAEIYLGAIYRSAGYPEDWRRTLDERIGFWPGPPDHALFGARSRHPEAFFEQAQRMADFLTRLDLTAIARADWDLLLLYQPEVDEVEHEFFLADSRQDGYTAERSARYQELVDRAYALADAELDRIARALSSEDTLFVVSDHGMTAAWADVSLNEILRQGGFLRLTGDGKVDPSSSAVAVPSGGIAHVYLNPGAPGGTLEGIEKLLADFRIGGESPWDRVVTRGHASALGLDAPESGDLIVLAKPGYAFETRIRPGIAAEEPLEIGRHGYRDVYPDLDAAFLAAGPGIAPGRAAEINTWDIAARVARALGIEPPRNARE
jgi:predicted AlkP superfamily pyrophosphatase or phosphodiesterase